jgi:hypothetical protein
MNEMAIQVVNKENVFALANQSSNTNNINQNILITSRLSDTEKDNLPDSFQFFESTSNHLFLNKNTFGLKDYII